MYVKKCEVRITIVCGANPRSCLHVGEKYRGMEILYCRGTLMF